MISKKEQSVFLLTMTLLIPADQKDLFFHVILGCNCFFLDSSMLILGDFFDIDSAVNCISSLSKCYCHFALCVDFRRLYSMNFCLYMNYFGGNCISSNHCMF